MLEARLKKRVKAMGGRVIKLPAMWYRGIPDRLVVLPGRLICFVELKRGDAPRDRSPHQVEWRTYLLSSGHRAYNVRGDLELDNLLFWLSVV